MKLTKKAAALLLAASLAVSVCATPVFAAPVNNGNNVQDSGEEVTTLNERKQACTKLTYSVRESYKWSIPADIEFGNDRGVNQEVAPTNNPKTTVVVSDCKIKNGKTLHIDIKGNGGGDAQVDNGNGEFKIKSDEGEALKYDVKIGDTKTVINTPVTSGDDVLTLEAGKAALTKYLIFKLHTADAGNNVSEKAGSYHGYAIFTAQLKDTNV